jgi:hypothetical protein
VRSRLSDYLASRWSWAWPVLGVALIAGQVVSLLGNLTAGQGDDFGAYLSAARRLIAGESLYLSSLLEGSALTTGPGQYLYPPPLAQLLAPLAVLPASWEKLLYFVYTAV